MGNCLCSIEVDDYMPCTKDNKPLLLGTGHWDETDEETDEEYLDFLGLENIRSKSYRQCLERIMIDNPKWFSKPNDKQLKTESESIKLLSDNHQNCNDTDFQEILPTSSNSNQGISQKKYTNENQLTHDNIAFRTIPSFERRE